MASFLRFASGDDGAGLPSIMRAHPSGFKARPDAGGIVRTAWGTPTNFTATDCGSIEKFMEAVMAREQMKFTYFSQGIPEPEEQFCGYFRDQALKEIVRFPPEWKKQDYTIRIKMIERQDQARRDCMGTILPDDKDCVMRLVKVSGGMNLATFTDKVALPLIGFCRNYHAWYYVAQTAPFISSASLKTRAVDRAHLSHYGHAWLDPDGLTVADMFPARPGASALFVYDIGDLHTFIFRVDSVANVADSTGSVEVLGGRGPAPPEDSCGYRDKGNGFALSLRLGQIDGRKAQQALNYNGRGGRAYEAWDPTKPWDKERYTAEVHAALASRLSDATQAKLFVTPISAAGQGLGRGMMEGFRQHKDPKKAAACAACGRVESLKLCAQCHGPHYCSRECQKKDWRRHKTDCRK